MPIYKAYIKSIQPRGATFTDEVMEKSFRFIVGKQGVETVCLLTDGAPFRNDYLDMNMVAAKIRKANRFCKARINTIGCFTGAAVQNKGMPGEPPRAELVGFLQRIATENNGVFKEIQGWSSKRAWFKSCRPKVTPLK